MDADSVIEDCLLLVQMSKLSRNEKLKVGVIIRRARQAVLTPGFAEPDKIKILAPLCNEIISLCNKTPSCEFTTSISFLSNLLDSCGTSRNID